MTEDTAPHPAVSAAPLPCDALAAERTLVMGILNVTPDSFSDGGQHYAATDAIAHAARMIAEGASIIDVGGESTRPVQALRISVEEEQRRILPVIEAVAQMGTTISVDTMNPQTARAAIAAGAHIINDVSGLNVSDEMIETAAELQVPYILMHARGTSQTMDSLAEYPRGVVTEVVEELTGLRERLLAAGVLPQNLILDPGLGFAKGGMQDWELLAAIDELQSLGHRLLIAGSRKRFIANALTAADIALAERLNATGFTATEAGQAERELWHSLTEPRPAQHRAAASAAVTALVAARGVWAVRVHDVPASVDAVTIASALRAVM
ncbi:dihydropteroate synthase [uncultured Rothia sp.]|uniref:dihydropteroate synthase n=1 Tax=uncultured Rothia sp. TaxID=316088 RepID=UPI0025DE78EC|nr:dihydropteroate synthase [uncultured Rothia sp.]